MLMLQLGRLKLGLGLRRSSSSSASSRLRLVGRTEDGRIDGNGERVYERGGGQSLSNIIESLAAVEHGRLSCGLVSCRASRRAFSGR